MNKFIMNRNQAFTLAEIMIVLVVIGVLTGILVPAAMNSMPNENVMKFKKAHNTLYRVINELVSNDKYYKDGDLGVRADDSTVGSKTLCETFADVISTKSVNCQNINNENYFIDIGTADTQTSNMAVFDNGNADNACKNAQSKVGEQIVTSDNIVYYDPSPTCHFALETNWNGMKRLFTSHVTSDTGMNRIYKVFCIDVDGFNKGEDPFGYGIRVDGKIQPDKRAKDWLQKSIQEKE